MSKALLLSTLLCLLLAPISFGASNDPLAGAAEKKAVVLLFIARDCPISNAYAPELQRLYARYAPRKIGFALVYPEAGITLADARKHARDFGYACPVFLDPSHHWARKAGATVTPEAAVFSPQGRLLYRGRIDDLFVGWGKRRPQATRHDLRDALDAILSGKPISMTKTTAIGCFIRGDQANKPQPLPFRTEAMNFSFLCAANSCIRFIASPGDNFKRSGRSIFNSLTSGNLLTTMVSSQ